MKPIPCRKFKNASTEDWMNKLSEECGEVMIEAERETLADTENLAEELTDVITVCVSWLDALGYDETARDALQAKINKKNKRRGYHMEGGQP